MNKEHNSKSLKKPSGTPLTNNTERNNGTMKGNVPTMRNPPPPPKKDEGKSTKKT